MSEKIDHELITKAINSLTEKISRVMLDEFLLLPNECQLNLVLIKSAQLLLANILCHVASDTKELKQIAEDQGEEMKEIVFTCAHTGFANKFSLNKH